MYPCLVRLSYANLHCPIDNNGKIYKSQLVTLLNGQTISFTKSDLVGIFDFHTNNVTDVLSNFKNLLGFERSTALSFILKR